MSPLLEPVDAGLPDPAADRLEGVGLGRPFVEVPDHRNPRRVRGPDPEGGAVLIEVRPENVVEALMAAFTKQPAVVVGDRADHGMTLLDTSMASEGRWWAKRRKTGGVYRAPLPKTSAGLTVASTRSGFAAATRGDPRAAAAKQARPPIKTGARFPKRVAGPPDERSADRGAAEEHHGLQGQDPVL